jgi:hypothetical protein
MVRDAMKLYVILGIAKYLWCRVAHKHHELQNDFSKRVGFRCLDCGRLSTAILGGRSTIISSRQRKLGSMLWKW